MNLVTVSFSYPIEIDGYEIGLIEGDATFAVYSSDEAYVREIEADGARIVDGKVERKAVELDRDFPLYNDLWCHVERTCRDDAIEAYRAGEFYTGPTRADIVRDDLAAAAE